MKFWVDVMFWSCWVVLVVIDLVLILLLFLGIVPVSRYETTQQASNYELTFFLTCFQFALFIPILCNYSSLFLFFPST